MKRNHEVRVKLTKEELEIIQRKAEASGHNPTEYLRYLGLNTQVKVTVED